MTEAEAMVEYVQSTSGRLDADQLPRFRGIVEDEIARQGSIRIRTLSGMFRARKGKAR